MAPPEIMHRTPSMRIWHILLSQVSKWCLLWALLIVKVLLTQEAHPEFAVSGVGFGAEGVEGFGRLGFRDLPASSTEVLKRSLDRTLLNDSDGRAPSSRAGSSAEELGWEVQLSDTVAARRIPYGSMYCTVWAYASQGVPI